ncbi:unnamed protein product [Protopolystoma xenopodis]|uniref:Uncharacterized protein n=1 Tax=Protopolystoma xenopodis TaxID=117903 RepID=A0A3S5BRN9_9PLAT|nr:unnamed protein product [Protopolystoma xenopodis]
MGYRKSDNTGLLATAASASQLHLVGEHIVCAGNGHLSNGGGDVSFSVDEWSNDMELDQCVKATCKAGKRYPVFQIRL